MFGPFGAGIVIFTFVLLMDWVLELVELVVNKGVKIDVILELLVYILPSLLVLTLPMAVLVATLTAFGRLSTDSEITALKASGISLYALYMPVLIFSAIVGIITFIIYAWALPWGNYQFLLKYAELARTNASIGLRAQVFESAFPGLDIYIDEIAESENTFTGVMISDARDAENPQIIFARRGRLIRDEEAMRVILRLEDGVSHPKDTETMSKKYQIVEFPALDIVLSLQTVPGEASSIPLTARNMGISQLLEQIVLHKQRDKNGLHSPEADVAPAPAVSVSAACRLIPQILWDSFVLIGHSSTPYLMELHKRFSFPMACLVFGLLGTPLGIQSRRAGKSGGYAMSLGLLIVYYIFMASGESLGYGLKIPVFFAIWMSNILLSAVGGLLLVRAAHR